MLKKLFFVLLIFTCFRASGQVFITLQLPPLGLTVKPQLWNLSLINAGSEAINIRIDLVMTDASNNQQVMTAGTNTFNLPKGIKQVTVNDVIPVSYNVTGVGYNIDASANGFLPIGTFHFCYIVTKVNNDAPERMGEECETVEVEPLSPPLLIMPVDSERVEITRPLFTWLPPSPFNLFNNLNYDWILTEVNGTQSAADAIQQNIPLLSQSSLQTTSYQYPLSMPELDTSKTYAWRVTAKNNSSVIANSEIWTFRVRKFSIDTSTHVTSGSYAKLRDVQDASYITSMGIVRFEYLNEYNSTVINLKIVDVDDPVHGEVALQPSTKEVKFGQNFIDLDLSSTSGMRQKHLYLLTVTNAKGEKKYLKFEFRKED